MIVLVLTGITVTISAAVIGSTAGIVLGAVATVFGLIAVAGRRRQS